MLNFMELHMGDTIVVLSQRPDARIVMPVPDGWSRVWKGRVKLGDMYFDRASNPPQWSRVDAPRLLKWTMDGLSGVPNDVVCVFFAIIREIDREVGSPCRICGIRPPAYECDVCCFCL